MAERRDPGNLRDYRPLLVRSLLLTTPVIVLYASQYLLDRPGTVYTGFIQFDMAFYMASARQYLELPGTLLYANPYDWDPASPRIYFQPLMWLLGQLVRFGMQPALALASIGLVATLASMSVLQLLLNAYRRLPKRLDDWILVLTAWGGGLFTITYLVTGADLDPGYGFWMLNLGRNFIFPTEAVYHLLTLALFLAVLKHRLWWAAALGLLIAVSHPITGAQYAAILVVWAVTQRLFEPGSIRLGQVAMLGLPLLTVIGYYLVYLPSFPRHREVMELWAFDFNLTWAASLAAYTPVAALAAHRLFARSEPIGAFDRFLILAALISFGLAHHDLLIDPVQPLHFTRGHIWFPLFLLGIPSLVAFVRSWKERYSPKVVRRLVVLLTFIGLFDNAVFFVNRSVNETGIFISAANHRLIEYFAARNDAPVVVTPDPTSTYLLPTYASARAYVGHWGITPGFAEKKARARDFLENGIPPRRLEGECIVVAVPSTSPPPPLSSAWRDSTIPGWTIFERPGNGCP